MEGLLKVEFHCHTVYSRDSLNGLKQLLRSCEKRGIDRLVITDHNTIAGAQRAKEMDPKRVIVGEEIVTREGGEILAFFVDEEVPGGLPAREAVRLLRDQGAFISLAHPFDYRRHGWTRSRLEEVLPDLDAIEVFNARALTAEVNHKAARFAAEQQLAGTVGSDAHTLLELGRATLRMPFFDSADELRQVIWQGQPSLRKSSILVHGGSRVAALVHAIAPKIGQK
jgi:hypothetical protein